MRCKVKSIFTFFVEAGARFIRKDLYAKIYTDLATRPVIYSLCCVVCLCLPASDDTSNTGVTFYHMMSRDGICHVVGLCHAILPCGATLPSCCAIMLYVPDASLRGIYSMPCWRGMVRCRTVQPRDLNIGCYYLIIGSSYKDGTAVPGTFSMRPRGDTKPRLRGDGVLLCCGAVT